MPLAEKKNLCERYSSPEITDHALSWLNLPRSVDLSPVLSLILLNLRVRDRLDAMSRSRSNLDLIRTCKSFFKKNLIYLELECDNKRTHLLLVHLVQLVAPASSCLVNCHV